MAKSIAPNDNAQKKKNPTIFCLENIMKHLVKAMLFYYTIINKIRHIYKKDFYDLFNNLFIIDYE